MIFSVQYLLGMPIDSSSSYLLSPMSFDNIERCVVVKEHRLNHSQKNYCLSVINDLRNKTIDSTCPICCTNDSDIITLCGHMFCWVCYFQMLKHSLSRRIFTCPSCRFNLHSGEMFEILPENTQSADKSSTKNSFLRKIEELLETNEKTLIFVQWKFLSRYLYSVLKKNGNRHVRAICGQTRSMQLSIEQFETKDVNTLIVSSDVIPGLYFNDVRRIIYAHPFLRKSFPLSATEDDMLKCVSGSITPPTVIKLTI